jgi:hypothetical protein
MEWFNSIGQWFVDNKENISAFVMSGNLMGFIANIVLLVKSLSGIKVNTSSTNALTEALASNEQYKTDIAKLSNDNETLKSELSALKADFADLKAQNELSLNKLSAMLDVQSLVYATIKDEPTRVAVLNILANAKYSETTQREKIKQELTALKEQVQETTNETLAKVTDTVEKATAMVENNVVLRG